MTRLTTQQFIHKSKEIHQDQDKYDYSLVDYVDTRTKVKIICQKHGEFEQTSYQHINRKQGCPDCSGNVKKTTQQFIIDAYCVHTDTYNYKLVDYKNNKTKVKIICPLHGVFEQIPKAHIKGQRCPDCYGNTKKNTEQFIQDAYCVHTDTYNYKLVDYKSNKTKIKIICAVHGMFEQIPICHLKGSGCPACGNITASDKRRKPIQRFLTDSIKIHQDKYDYSLVEYVNNMMKVKIICPDHGVFVQIPGNHLQGKGCKKCSTENTSNILRKTTEHLIQDAYCIHKDKYNYKLVQYVNAKTKVKIICPKHGKFEQTPDSHLRGDGCPRCILNISKQETELQEWLKDVMKKLTTEQFIQKAKDVHQDKYDYSLVEYVNNKTKVKIICPLHGMFEQIPSNHVNLKQGCPDCKYVLLSDKFSKTTEQFIQKAKDVHQDKYDYSLVDYKNWDTKVKIICPLHGVFEQTPHSHLKGSGCPECANILISNKSKFNTNTFIQKAKQIHQDKYDYSLVEYKKYYDKVKIICPLHGEFKQTPNVHLQGCSCPKCACHGSKQEIVLQDWLSDIMKKLTTEQFIHKSKEIHQDKYDYSLVEYINAKTKVKIICPVHGIFEQTSYQHINRKQGCPECSGNVKKTTQQFIQDAYCKHGDTYNYKLVDYKNNSTKVKIICPLHGVFEQTPSNHLQGSICRKCKYILLSDKFSKTTEQFIHKSKQVHQDKYDYSLVDYVNAHTKVKIICHIHGIIEQTPHSHLKGCECYKCTNNYIDDKDTFIHKSKQVHQDKYDYSLVEYKNNSTKVKIICPKHGVFEQRPGNHINLSHNCPKCSNKISKQETYLQEWLSDNNIICNDRVIIKPYELDIVIPDKKICIEYNGLYWHSEQRGKDRKYHLNKYNLCKDKGYRLIQIWENEWLHKQDIVKSIILNAIGINKRIIHGRKCRIQNVSVHDARIMYDDNHIQGFKGGLHKGLYFEDELVSLMSIDSRNELQRFVNLKYTKVHGAFSKLLKSFIKDGYKDIYTFADLRYFTGDVYKNNGFKYVHTTTPNYYYFKGMQVYHRMNFQKKNIQKKFNQGELEYFDPDKTEYQNMLDNGYDRIWDCGNMKFTT